MVFKKKILLLSGISLWLAAVCWSMKLLTDYSFTAAEQGTPAVVWPAGTEIHREEGRFTLVLALHPECPCSRATLNELDAVGVNTLGKLSVLAVFVDNLPDAPADRSDLHAKAHALPRVKIVRDRDGTLLNRFAFRTSGEVRLYRPDGTLAFSGGITPSRGHEGDNVGRSAIVAAVNHRGSEPLPFQQTPVFGCALGTN